MRRSTLFWLALVSMAVVAIKAPTPVRQWHLLATAVTSYGHSKAVAIRRALETARQLYGADVRLIAASDVTGYGAVAVARKGNGSVIGAALGARRVRKRNTWQSRCA